MCKTHFDSQGMVLNGFYKKTFLKKNSIQGLTSLKASSHCKHLYELLTKSDSYYLSGFLSIAVLIGLQFLQKV